MHSHHFIHSLWQIRIHMRPTHSVWLSCLQRLFNSQILSGFSFPCTYSLEELGHLSYGDPNIWGFADCIPWSHLICFSVSYSSCKLVLKVNIWSSVGSVFCVCENTYQAVLCSSCCITWGIQWAWWRCSDTCTVKPMTSLSSAVSVPLMTLPR